MAIGGFLRKTGKSVSDYDSVESVIRDFLEYCSGTELVMDYPIKDSKEDSEVDTKKEYDDSGRLIRETWNDGYWEAYKYDDSGNLVSMRSSDTNRWTDYEYDSDNHLIRKKISVGWMDGI